MLHGARIAVIGESVPEDGNYELAYQLGCFLGESNCTVFCGGLGGIMEAVSKGVKEGGGTTIGILPGLDKNDANPYIDIPVVTGIGYARNSIVANNGDVVIAVGGQFGTLSEIAYALHSQIPVIAINSWSLHKKEEIPANYHPVNTLNTLKEKLLLLLPQE